MPIFYGDKWSKLESELIFRLRPYCTLQEIVNILNKLGFIRSKDAIRRKSNRLNVMFQRVDVPDLEGLSSHIIEIIKHELGLRVPHLHPTYPLKSAPKSDILDANSLLEELTTIKRQLRKNTPISLKNKHSSKAAILVISDWHLGRFSNIENRKYNIDIATSRWNNMFSQFIDVVDDQNTDEIVLVLAGDLTDGTGIFPGQEEMLELSPILQVSRGTALITESIIQLEERFPNKQIRIVTVPGNHGRVGSSKITNYDNLIYLVLETFFLKEKSKTTILTNNFGCEHNIINVCGWKFLLRHKAPVHADAPAARDKFAGWYAKYKYDAMIYGHFHHWGVLNWNHLPIFRNGSGMGSDELADEIGVDDPATQLTIIVSENKLPESIIPLYLENETTND